MSHRSAERAARHLGKRNLNFIIETLINNNYPLQFIFNTIQIKLKSLFNKRTKKQVTDIPEEERIID